MTQVSDPNGADHSDMYVGCFDGYSWDQIKFLVNSLDRTGFTGRKVMIVLLGQNPLATANDLTTCVGALFLTQGLKRTHYNACAVTAG